VSEAGAPDDATYVRGARGGLDRGLAIRIMAGAVVVALVTLTLVLAFQADRENSRLNRLHHDGIPVNATVSGCVAIASGTGITESGYRCRASYVLTGRSYSAVLGGTDTLYAVGETVPAVVARTEPDNLSTADAVMHTQASWTAFIPAAIAMLTSIALTAVLAWRIRRTGHT
jgi:hypothetical protein